MISIFDFADRVCILDYHPKSMLAQKVLYGKAVFLKILPLTFLEAFFKPSQ
jgi:hypothetical protein